MIKAATIGGFFCSHAVWSLADGEPVIPILAYLDREGARMMQRIVADDYGDSVRQGQEQLSAPELDAETACLVYDGHVTLDDVARDALIIELRGEPERQSSGVITLPYQPATTGVFSIHRPQWVSWDGPVTCAIEQAIEAFFQGAESHEKGWAVWQQNAFRDGDS